MAWAGCNNSLYGGFEPDACKVTTVGVHPVEELPEKGIPITWKQQERFLNIWTWTAVLFPVFLALVIVWAIALSGF